MKENSSLIELKSRWEQYLTIEEVMRIIQACRINAQEISEIKAGIINDKEYTAKVHSKVVTDNDIIKESPVIISFRLGPPTWEQFIRTTYRSGSSAGIRIIVHEGDESERNNNDPTGNINLIGYLINNNNCCGMKTYLVDATGLIQCISEGRDNQIIYSYEIGPTDNDQPLKRLPSLRQIQEAEFWNCYYLLPRYGYNDELMELYGVSENWSLGHSSFYKDLSEFMTWNDDGLYINLTGNSDSALIRLIWETKLDDFKKGYPSAKIELMEAFGKPYGISMRILDIPMKNLIKMGPERKMQYGKFVHEAGHNFLHFIDAVLCDLKNMGKIQE